MGLYTLSSKVFLDKHNKCYKNIIVINKTPDGPLRHIIQRKNMPKLSEFQTNSPCYVDNKCTLVVMNPNNLHEMLTVTDISNLFSFLIENNYKINTDITKIMQKSSVKLNKLICFIEGPN